MDLSSLLATLLFVLQLPGIFAGLREGNCTNHVPDFDKVFSVPGEMAMLVTSKVFSYPADPYNITWYDMKTGREVSSKAGRILVRGETLWFLNVTMDDHGEYVSALRTSTRCYKQAITLVVEQPVHGDCARPRTANQMLTNGVTGTLTCPLMDCMVKLKSYNVSYSLKWYNGCDLIEDGVGQYEYKRNSQLKVSRVDSSNNGAYTCSVTFTLAGVTGSMSETIAAWVSMEYSLAPQIREPIGEAVKVEIGSNFTKPCQVFVPCKGKPDVILIWQVNGNFLWNTKPSARLHATETRNWSQVEPIEGEWLEKSLVISEVKEEDLYINYTCEAHSSRGIPRAYFTLLPEDPNVILPIGLLLGGATFLFILSVVTYRLFEMDIVLWLRRAFPVLYANTDLDGKLYDAYVAYPSKCDDGYSNDVETFAIQTLPQVLEKACGYKLFIAGRDCQPGQAIVDSVEENIEVSRRFLLVYDATTFCGKKRPSSTYSNNNNIVMESQCGDPGGTDGVYFNKTEGISQDPRQRLEVVFATHRALLEGTLKVVLVELEEISPAQLATFPESVRHLRKKQGAVCWWKNQRRGPMCRPFFREAQDEDKCEKATQRPSPDLSPSSRFWKEMRYHMPVRGKRAVYPEKTALLDQK